MPRQRKQEYPGRPIEYSIDRKPISILWPVDILEHIQRVSHNRTRWLIEAAREKMEREKRVSE